MSNRILIVDDNPCIHEDFRKILVPAPPPSKLIDLEAHLFGAEMGSISRGLVYDLESVMTAEHGLETFRQAFEQGQPYAVVFADVRLPPGRDGVDMIESIWELAPQTQVVIMSAFSDYTWEDLIERFGWSDRLIILRKPFDAITIKQLALLMSRRWLAEHALIDQRKRHLGLVEEKARLERRCSELHQLFEQAADAMFVVAETNGHILDANRELRNLCGAQPRFLTDLVHEEDLHRWRAPGRFISALRVGAGPALAVEASSVRGSFEGQSCLSLCLRPTPPQGIPDGSEAW